MQNSVLILGANGRFGRHAAAAFGAAGWNVQRFDRARHSLMDAARGTQVIVNGWNPPYPAWAHDIPDQTRQLIEVAEVSGALVVVPGNVYPFGDAGPSRLAADTPHAAQNPLGKVRAEMEAAWRGSRARVLILRCGDFLDTSPSGNWFDKILIAGLDRGRLAYPGPMDRHHAWTFLPDAARAVVDLCERADQLERYADIGFPGYTLTGSDLQAALERAAGRPIRARRMAWLPLRIAAPVWPMGRALLEMSYLWRKAHFIDGSAFHASLPDFRETPLDQALQSAIHFKIHPDQTVAGGDDGLIQSRAA